MRVFRKLFAFETCRLSEHLLRLSPADRHLRFCAAIDDSTIVDHCDRIDLRRAVVVGFFEQGVLRGAAELHLGPDNTAELAITLEADWQDRHIGTELLGHAVTVAENRGVRTLAMLCLLSNRRIQHIVRKLDGRLAIVADQAEATVRLPHQTPRSLWDEAAMEGMGLVSGWLEIFDPATGRSPAAA